jgi:hypothetical protein
VFGCKILTAILVDPPVWGANCSKISFELKKSYDFTNNSCTFLDEFNTLLPEEASSYTEYSNNKSALHLQHNY